VTDKGLPGGAYCGGGPPTEREKTFDLSGPTAVSEKTPTVIPL